MNKYALLLPISLLFCLSDAAFCKESPLKPWTPYGQTVATSGVVTAAVVQQIPRSQTAAIPLTHFSSSQPAHALNHIKGEFGEKMMDSVFTNRFLEKTGSWSVATPARIGRTGIDGLYFKVDTKGLPTDLMISDAKFGSARLGMTKDGKQMSEKWIKQRLQQTAKMYKDMANTVERNGATRVTRFGNLAKNQVTARISIPLNNKTNIEVCQAMGKIQYFSDSSVTPAEVQKQLTRMAYYLDGAAEGKIGYRSRLFSYKPAGKEHVFTIYTLDAQANVISTEQIRGEYAKLPRGYRYAIESKVKSTLGTLWKSNKAVDRLTQEICDDPVKFNRICMQPRHSYMAGLDRGALKVSVGVGLVVMGVDAAMQYWENGKIDVRRLATTGVITAGSVLAGNYVGTQASILLTRSGLPGIGGSMLGGGIGSVIFAYGMYAAGHIDIHTAHKTASTGIVITTIILPGAQYLALYGAMKVAAIYGVSGTGTAISSLSGVAATNAAAAWLGGGTLASGGGGMAAAGSSILVTGGTAVIVIAAVVAVERTFHYVSYFKNERDQQRYLAGIIDLTRGRVEQGKQLEWQIH